MSLLSKTCEYALRAVIFLAQRSAEGRRYSAAEIASDTGASEFFAAKILQKLGREGIISSAKGPRGGFFMTEENTRKSLGDVVRVIDGESLFAQCLLGLPHCSDKNPCPMHRDFKPIRQQIIAMMDGVPLARFVEDADLQTTFLKLKKLT